MYYVHLQKHYYQNHINLQIESYWGIALLAGEHSRTLLQMYT